MAKPGHYATPDIPGVRSFVLLVFARGEWREKMTARQNRLFCFGFGFSAERLARDLLKQGWLVAGTCRDQRKLESLEAAGIEAFIFNDYRPLASASEALSATTHLLTSVPPGPEGDPVLIHHRQDIASIDGLAWVGYLSTTGVYGNRNGDWVDETSDRTPSGDRGARRVAAENAWLDLWRLHEVPVHLFRLAGIYGPGRNALETVRSGRARRVDKPGQVFSRIHVDDIAQVIEASIGATHPGRAYNVCDDEAAPPEEIVEFACRLLGVEPPPLVPFEKAELTPMARSFYADNKRVSNKRIKQELAVHLKWPTFREGLRGLLESAAKSTSS
jgi:nucleoside-diphosphate-sugar epimerase